MDKLKNDFTDSNREFKVPQNFANFLPASCAEPHMLMKLTQWKQAESE